MKNLSVKSSNKLIVKYILRIIISTFLSLFLLSFICSQIIYRLDLSMEHREIISLFIAVISSFIISFISSSGFKNNGAVVGAVSEFLLIIISFINLVFNDNSPLMFIIKIFAVLLIGAAVGYFKVKKNNTFKV